VPGLDESPEILTRKVGGEGEPLVVTPRAAGGRLFSDDCSADCNELGKVIAVFLELDLQPNPDDTVGAECVSFGLHARHGELARVVHRLAELVEFHVLAPAPRLDSDVVDARTEDQPDRSETGLSYEQKLVHR